MLIGFLIVFILIALLVFIERHDFRKNKESDLEETLRRLRDLEPPITRE